VSRHIEEDRGRFEVEPICEALDVSASAYYQRKTGQRSTRQVSDERVLARIREVHAANYNAYGYQRSGRHHKAVAGLMRGLGRVRDDFDHAMMAAFWARLQTELLDRRKWHTRLQLCSAIFEYLKIIYNRKRRHGAPEMLTAIQYETLHQQRQAAA